MSVGLHGESALEDVVHIDTTVHEKHITYPTDSKLAIKIINRLNKYFTATHFRQSSEVTAPGYSVLPAREEKSQGQTRIKAAQNHCRYSDAGTQERITAVLSV